MSENKRWVWLDLLRVTAILLMVLLHVAAGYVSLWSVVPKADWLVANAFDSLSRACVPWLVMVSGALLLPQLKTTSWQIFYRKRLMRLFRPWLFWSVIFGAINLWQGNDVGSLKRLLVGTVWTGFWLLPVLMVLYLLAPVWFQVSYRLKAWQKWLLICLGLLILLSGWHSPLYLEYLVYFVLGQELAQLPVTRWWRHVGFSCLLLGWLLVMILTYWASLQAQALAIDYYLFNSWPVALMSVGGFLFLAQLRNFWQKISLSRARLLAKLSTATFQLYFIHLLFFRFNINWVQLPALVFIPISTVLIFTLSWWGVKLLQQNRWLARLSGAEERT